MMLSGSETAMPVRVVSRSNIDIKGLILTHLSPRSSYDYNTDTIIPLH
jgi:hypothetical protein